MPTASSPPPAPQQFSAVHVRSLLGAALQAGVAEEDALADGLADVTAVEWLDVPRYAKLLDRIVALSRDDAFGLHWAERSLDAVREALAALVSHAETFRVAVGAIQRGARLFSTVGDIRLVEGEDEASLAVDVGLDPWPRLSRVHAELAMVAFCRMVRTFAGSDRAVLRATFAHPAPAYRGEYTRLFAGKERFGGDVTELVFDRAVLDRPQRHASAELRRAAEVVFEEQLSRVEGSGVHAKKVREHLSALPPSARPDVDSVARALGMSERSLRRRLAEEGVRWADLARETQALAARRLLARPGSTIQQVAYELGFADPTAFHRAFRRWTGMTPSQFRENGDPTPRRR